MLDPKYIRENPQNVKDACKKKNKQVDVDRLLHLDAEKLSLSQAIESLNAQKKQCAANRDIEWWKRIKEELSVKEATLRDIETEYIKLAYQLPNIPHPNVPEWVDDTGNVVIERHGSIPEFDFDPKPHWELWKEKLIDAETASRVSGSRFSYIRWGAARIQFALVQLCFDTLTNEDIIGKIIQEEGLSISPKAFLPIVPPVIVNMDVMKKMWRLDPMDERYCLPDDNQVLVGSAEHSLGPIHMNEIIPEDQLPIRYIGYSTSFRREAGSSGKDTAGILRQHQFDKLEMETFSTSESSGEEQLLMVGVQKYLMNALELPFEVMDVCTGDMWGPDARQYDINTWIPTQWVYRETHSADLMTDYQSRRLKIRYKDSDNKKHLVHMNDATAFAIGRTLIAILENNQNADGSVNVPEVLQKWVGASII